MLYVYVKRLENNVFVTIYTSIIILYKEKQSALGTVGDKSR